MTNNFTPAKAGQQSKRLSKEEYAEKMKAEKEAVYQMADDTAKAIVSDPEKFKAFLDILGVSGGGKSFAAKGEIENIILSSNADVING